MVFEGEVPTLLVCPCQTPCLEARELLQCILMIYTYICIKAVDETVEDFGELKLKDSKTNLCWYQPYQPLNNILSQLKQ